MITGWTDMTSESSLASPQQRASSPAERVPAQNVPAVGIDLGTTYSVLAYLDPQGRPTCIPNVEGDLLTPSVVLFDDDGVVVGKQAVAAASIEPERVAESTRMPMVIKMLGELAGKAVDHSVAPDEAVAQGAALYADLLLQRQGSGGGHAQFTVTNVNSHSLGVVGVDGKTGSRVNRVIIPKNTPLPRSKTKRFKTFKANQVNVKVTVLEGESEVPDACIEVGTCVIRDLPPSLPGGWPVEVRYSYQENGRLQVSAKLVGHGARVTAEFIRDNSLSDDDLLLWGQALADEAARNTD